MLHAAILHYSKPPMSFHGCNHSCPEAAVFIVPRWQPQLQCASGGSGEDISWTVEENQSWLPDEAQWRYPVCSCEED